MDIFLLASFLIYGIHILNLIMAEYSKSQFDFGSFAQRSLSGVGLILMGRSRSAILRMIVKRQASPDRFEGNATDQFVVE